MIGLKLLVLFRHAVCDQIPIERLDNIAAQGPPLRPTHGAFSKLPLHGRALPRWRSLS